MVQWLSFVLVSARECQKAEHFSEIQSESGFVENKVLSIFSKCIADV